MYEDLISKIKFAANTFTNAEKKIAEYILSNPQKVLYMSISELADTCDVGDTSVFRFCRHLDKKGYMDFKMDLAQTLTSRGELGVSSGVDREDDSLEAAAQRAINDATAAMHETLNMNGTANIKEVAKLMHKANRIFFFGMGSSMASAYEGYCRFMRVSPKAACLFDSHMQTMYASLMQPGDVAIAFSYTGATKDTIDIAEEARRADASVVAITHFSSSALTDISDHVLLCGANEDPSQSGSFTGKLSQLFILDLLYTEFYQLSLPESKENLTRAMKSISEKLM